jgi:hypothetical protein
MRPTSCCLPVLAPAALCFSSRPGPVPAAVPPAPSPPTKDGFVVGKVTAVFEVRAELADTPPRAVARRPRSKRHNAAPGFNTPQEPAAKKGMVEDSEEEGEGTDADIRRWVEAEHMEAELEEEDADEEVRGFYSEEAKRPRTKQRSYLMESEGSEGEAAAQARRGPLFTDENLSMGG